MVLNEWIIAIGKKKNPDFIFKNSHRKCILPLSDQGNAVGKTQLKSYFECFYWRKTWRKVCRVTLNDEQVWGNLYLHVTILQRERNNKSCPEMRSLAPELIVSNSPRYSSSLQGLGAVAEVCITAFCNEANPTLRWQHINRTLGGQMHIKQITCSFFLLDYWPTCQEPYFTGNTTHQCMTASTLLQLMNGN